MTRQQALNMLSSHKDSLRRMDVASLALFGSLARDEAGDQSDVDLLVEFNQPVGLFHFFRLQHHLENILGVPKVDLVEKTAVHPGLKDTLLSEAVHVS